MVLVTWAGEVRSCPLGHTAHDGRKPWCLSPACFFLGDTSRSAVTSDPMEPHVTQAFGAWLRQSALLTDPPWGSPCDRTHSHLCAQGLPMPAPRPGHTRAGLPQAPTSGRWEEKTTALFFKFQLGKKQNVLDFSG